jgi:hypothetical protein
VHFHRLCGADYFVVIDCRAALCQCRSRPYPRQLKQIPSVIIGIGLAGRKHSLSRVLSELICYRHVSTLRAPGIPIPACSPEQGRSGQNCSLHKVSPQQNGRPSNHFRCDSSTDSASATNRGCGLDWSGHIPTMPLGNAELWVLDQWILIDTDLGRKMAPGRRMRCPECHGAVRFHEGSSGVTAQFEHLEGNPGCSLGDCFDGTRRPHGRPMK